MYKNFVTFSFIFGYKNKRNCKNVCHTHSCTSYTIGPGHLRKLDYTQITKAAPAFCFLSGLSLRQLL